MDNYMYLVPVAAVVALLFAAYLANKVSKMDAGRCSCILRCRVQDSCYLRCSTFRTDRSRNSKLD